MSTDILRLEAFTIAPIVLELPDPAPIRRPA